MLPGWLAGLLAGWLAGWLAGLLAALAALAGLLAALAGCAGWLAGCAVLGDSFGPCWAHSFGPWARAHPIHLGPKGPIRALARALRAHKGPGPGP